MKKGMILAMVVCIMTAITIPAQAGDLYDELCNMNPKEILFELYQKESFSQEDCVDLDLLFAENAFTDNMIVSEFQKFQKKGLVPVAEAYQEVLVYHQLDNLLPSLVPGDIDGLKEALRAKAGIFEGSVRLVGVFVDQNGQGACRWVSPNAFIVLYVVREALREALEDETVPFASDGASLVTQI